MWFVLKACWPSTGYEWPSTAAVTVHKAEFNTSSGKYSEFFSYYFYVNIYWQLISARRWQWSVLIYQYKHTVYPGLLMILSDCTLCLQCWAVLQQMLNCLFFSLSQVFGADVVYIMSRKFSELISLVNWVHFFPL